MKIFNVALLACALEIGIVAAAQPFRNIDHLADFEKDLRGWDIQSDLPHDNNNRGFPVRAYIERSDE